jgi:pimeloyl-ACP methyl ester carboxylesterase
MDTKKLNYKSRSITYYDHGKGDVTMLVHGFGEQPGIWKNQLDILSFRSHVAGEESGRLIIPHLPGSGESEMIDDMSMEGMADCLLAILDKENISQCILIGHSMGGYITMAFAEKYPDRLKAFGLFHSSAFADNDAKKETRRKGIAFIKEHGAYPFLETMIPNLYSSATKTHAPELLQEHKKSAQNFSAETLIAYYEAMIARPDRTEVLKKTKLPVLFIMGREDQAVPMEDSLKQCHLPEISYVEILENSGHMGMVEEKEAVNKFLVDFITFCTNIRR